MTALLVALLMSQATCVGGDTTFAVGETYAFVWTFPEPEGDTPAARAAERTRYIRAQKDAAIAMGWTFNFLPDSATSESQTWTGTCAG